MLLLVKKYRKGVSPVIAVVLLIALTVAAAAVIWTLTSGILDANSGKGVTVISVDAGSVANGNISLTVTLKADDAGTITGIQILSAPSGVTFGSQDSVIANNVLIKGSEAHSFVIYGASGLVSGSYKFQISYTLTGGNPATVNFDRSLTV